MRLTWISRWDMEQARCLFHKSLFHLERGKGADAIIEADISSSASTANDKRVWGIAANQ